MNNNHFDFKDLMSFGMFILSLLTFIYLICNRVTGWLTSILHRMGVVLMNNNHFDFKDLMSFGMFILSLLTFIYLICH